MWRADAISAGEYFQGLIYSARFAGVESVVNGLNQEELSRFQEFLHDVTDAGDTGEWVTIGSPPTWRFSDAEALLSHINKTPSNTQQADTIQ